MNEDDRSPLVRQLSAFRLKMLETLADLQVDLTAYEMALKEKGVSTEQLQVLKQEARPARDYWLDQYAERFPVLDGLQ